MTGASSDEIITIIANAIAHRYWLRPKPEVMRDTQFDDLGADSLDLVTIAMACEEAFGLEIYTNDIARWRCVADVMQSVDGNALA